MLKDKQIFVPARADKNLIKNVNRARKKAGITWVFLIESLFSAYLKSGETLWTKKTP